MENMTLRERLEQVEGILNNNKDNYESMTDEKRKNNIQKSNTQYG
jgi:hypothetical protein